MALPVLIITYRRFDFVLEILSRLQAEAVRNVYLTIDDFNGDPSFVEVERFLQEHFRYKLRKWNGNVGCDINVIEGIKWFFEFEESGIIIEDDCIPEPGFSQLSAQLQQPGFSNRVVSFYTPDQRGGCELEPSLLPFYWGWYCPAGFYREFYRFYNQPVKSLRQIPLILTARYSAKLKLITLINFFSHRVNERGTAWDSELFYYMMLKRHTLLIPSVSFIDNKGFGDLDSAFTHTSVAPEWYSSPKNGTDTPDCPGFRITTRQKDDFLDRFYAAYPDNLARLLVTFSMVYLKYLLGIRPREGSGKKHARTLATLPSTINVSG